MTCPRWFLDSLQNPSKVFDIPRLTGRDFEIRWTLVEFMLFMIGQTIIWDILSSILSGMWSSWVYCKILWSNWSDRHVCLDTQSRPPRRSELVVSILLNRGVNNRLLVPVYCWTDCRSKNWMQVLQTQRSCCLRNVELIWSGEHLLLWWRGCDLRSEDAVFEMKTQLSLSWIDAALAHQERRDSQLFGRDTALAHQERRDS